jgi:xylulokinase
MEAPDFERRFINRTYLNGRWIFHAPTSTSGAALTWLKRVFFDDGMEMDEFYRQISKRASRSQAGSGGLYFLPYLQGERSPWWDSDARGVFAGLSLGTSSGDIIRSVLEGIAYALKQNLDIAEENAGTEYKELLFTGGGSRNDLWLDIKSHVTGKVLKVMEFDETAILGAALLGGVCAGIYRDSVEAASKTGNKSFRYVKPDMGHHQQYCRYSSRFKSLYLALKPEFKKMKEAY